MSEAPKSTAIAPTLAAGNRPVAIIPQTFDDCYRMGKLLAISGLVPKDYKDKPEACTVAIMQGLEVGLSPMAALQSIAVINGRPSIWGDGALAIIRASGLLEKFDETDDGKIATCTVKRRGEEPIVRTFSIEDSEKANLANKDGPWKTYPRRMRQMRARSWALRDGFADILKGLQVAEEQGDVPMRDITPRPALASAQVPDLPEIPDVPDAAPVIDGEVVTESELIADEAGFLAHLEEELAAGDAIEVWADNEHMIERLSPAGQAKMLKLKPVAEAAE